MSINYTFPTPIELRAVEQQLLPRLTEDDLIFDEFPIVESNMPKLRWEQRDNYYGLQQVRGLNGAPNRVNRIGTTVYEMEPGVYGEFTTLDEAELTLRRELGTFDEPISIDDLVGMDQELLLTRRLDRIRQILWNLVTAGTFSVSNRRGQILHTDTFPLKTSSGSTAWSNTTTATPLADIRAAQLLSRGQSVDFGSNAKLVMNRTQVNNFLLNTNAADFGGKRTQYGSTLNTLDEANKILLGNDLPAIECYDRTYQQSQTNGDYALFVPSGTGVLIGKRTNGAKLGEYRMTRNANNPRMEGGPYTRVVDWGELEVPRRIDVHDGHSGGPVIYYPGAICIMTI